MDERPLKVLLLLGTTRQGRMTEHAAQLVHERLARRSNVDAHLVDVRDLSIPGDDEGETLKDPAFSAAIDEADGLVIVSPEYNHGYPGMLKHAIDTNLAEYFHKVAGVVGVSSGPVGGRRMIENLLPVLRGLGLVVISRDVSFTNVGKVFAEDGTLLDDRYTKRIEAFLDELIWAAQTLRYGREHIPSKGVG